MTETLIRLKHISKSFPKMNQQDVLVLDDVNLSLYDGEIIALLGKSGSGKSTLLRIAAGLVAPSQGEVYYRGETVTQPVSGIAMVFQHFALMPWLNVFENVELGLEAQGIGCEERRQRTLKAIDTIGLDGFETAFPRELSGGMQQRVGFARALVVAPDVLLMDEPFSALDVLTAENLKTDLLDLWEDKQTKIRGILFVTHSIEEAVLLADRIIIVGSNPGRIQSQLRVDLPHPRNPHGKAFKANVSEVYAQMTNVASRLRPTHLVISLGYRLPAVEVSELMGLIETIAANPTEENDLQQLADNLHLDVDDLFPLLELLDILHFALISKTTIGVTHVGRAYAEADILRKKEIFAEQLLSYVPLARYIRASLDSAPEHRIKKATVVEVLKDYLSDSEAERVMTTIIDWARYSEIFAYTVNTQELSLENPK